ncbi:cyclase family protein [Streptomyces sp. NPDC051985]|uniref:cyclase family protein n=1 Tax=Streptomyces sp. NPDC051985 TaxID=3155807 RepID=UPI00343FE5F4
MGRTTSGDYVEGAWSAPGFSVDGSGRIVGLVNDNVPNNWGRWGEDDQRGTANFITPEAVAAAAALIRTGRTISLAVPLDATGPVHPTRPNVVHLFGYSGADHAVGSDLGRIAPGFQGADDYLFMPLQGSTQWDGLAHIFHRDAMYNGFWMGNVEGFGGARKCSIQLLKDSLTSRGVLLDVAGHLRAERCAPGVPITADLLDACAQAQGVEIGTGDILLVRTGHVPWYYALADKQEFWSTGAPGLALDTVEWIHQHEIAALAVDNVAVEVEPSEDPERPYYPLHVRLIRDLGLTLGEVWWLEELAAECAEQGRYEFFLTASPLNITGGAGSPVNPLAIF